MGARGNMRDRAKGFTLIEILMVVAIIGVMLAVIVPRGWRANVDAKYNMVRQSAAELASWGLTWAERNLNTQDVSHDSDLNDYVGTLHGYTGNNTNTNWVSAQVNVPNRGVPATRPKNGVLEIMPSDKELRNPFNGVSYFESVHDGNVVQPGLLYLATATDTSGGTTYDNYYFLFLGQDSNAAAQWHAGMGTGANPPLANLRNGVFMTRLAR